MNDSKALLRVCGLSLAYPGPSTHKPADHKVSFAVNNVSFSVQPGDVFGIVGESGSGKSSLARSILQLVKPSSGEVFFEGHELTRHWRKKFGRWVWNDTLRDLRQQMQLIFQDPKASLNPRLTIRQCIEEPLLAFGNGRSDTAKLRSIVDELIQQVGLGVEKAEQFPHQLSGGQNQRVVIARALALRPRLVIADEPVSALDLSVRGQILNLLKSLQADLGLTYIYISHDLSTVRYICDRVAVMHQGEIIEEGEVEGVFSAPQHPRTRELVAAARNYT